MSFWGFDPHPPKSYHPSRTFSQRRPCGLVLGFQGRNALGVTTHQPPNFSISWGGVGSIVPGSQVVLMLYIFWIPLAGMSDPPPPPKILDPPPAENRRTSPPAPCGIGPGNWEMCPLVRIFWVKDSTLTMGVAEGGGRWGRPPPKSSYVKL